VEQSSELKEFYRHICEAFTNGDYSFFERHISQQDGVLSIGTDPTEWVTGYATIIRGFKIQVEEMAGCQLLAGTPHAYRDGSIGWVADQPTLQLPDGMEIPLRCTAVFQQEQKDWKIVQWHVSVGISNEELIGKTLTIQ
jgi:hypothetical protein